VAGGAYHNEPAIVALEDVDRLVPPQHRIDEARTRRNVERLQEAVGDILAVNVDRGPHYRMWAGDLSTDLGHLRGIEQFMWDMMDHPEWLHRLLGFMRDGVLRTHEQAEAAGDWSLSCHQNQAMAYAEELPDPAPNTPAQRSQLWTFVAAQEYTLVSPPMHDEFLLRYQLPLMAPFGLAAYGCCEDLTKKIGLLRQIPNLRRIAVTPVADVARCAEQIGSDYVVSWRPNPAEVMCCGFDRDRIRQAVRRAMDACAANGCHVDITLKDVETIGGEPWRLAEWVKVVREVSDSYLPGAVMT
jgi:hypothetical protein